MDNLIHNISDALKARCIRPNSSNIERLLAKLNISDGYEFGKHYNYKQPFGKFADDYLAEYVYCAEVA